MYIFIKFQQHFPVNILGCTHQIGQTHMSFVIDNTIQSLLGASVHFIGPLLTSPCLAIVMLTKIVGSSY